MDRYSKFKNAISHKVKELKSSAADGISIISIPIKNQFIFSAQDPVNFINLHIKRERQNKFYFSLCSFL